MSSITREQAQKIIDAADEVITALAGTNEDVHPDNSTKMVRLYDDLNDHYAPPEVVRELARIALESLEAEAVCVIDQSNLDYLKSGSDADVWPASRAEMGDVLLYRSAPPAPVSVPDAMEMDDDFDSAFEHGKAVGWNAYRAAMLQGADGNSPVIPDGWVLVPEEPTHEMLEAGDEQFGTYDVYRRMIAASPQQEVK
ncbi:hypothetical protein [Enterobacter roggenkampii]|uniref:hypothetical protein n=1 Tax=Enterobacter roggenkampii TaxID=1812935 RepID=UPI00292A2EE6|nr:hypothetical protein [Enterobacter roggenkampii]MDV0394416.1 hypothetical protein [Enterobacter roggenkampii]